MKFMVEYRVRYAGLTAAEAIENNEALLTAFGKWAPEAGLKVLAFVGKVAGAAGYVLIEADDPRIVQSFVTKFNFWNDMTVVPVIDIAETVPVTHASVAWAKAAMKG